MHTYTHAYEGVAETAEVVIHDTSAGTYTCVCMYIYIHTNEGVAKTAQLVMHDISAGIPSCTYIYYGSAMV